MMSYDSIHIYMYIHIYIYIYTFTYKYIHRQIRVHAHVHTYTHIRIHMHMHVNIHYTYTYTYTYLHIHIRIPSFVVCGTSNFAYEKSSGGKHVTACSDREAYSVKSRRCTAVLRSNTFCEVLESLFSRSLNIFYGSPNVFLD